MVNTWESQQLCNIYQKKLQPDEELNGVLYLFNFVIVIGETQIEDGVMKFT